MKKMMTICFCLIICIGANAQKSVPEIKPGSIMNAMALVNGQEFPLVLTVNSLTAPLSIGWSVDGYGEGAFEMSAKAVDNATKLLNVTQPALGVTKLADDETFCILSKEAYKSLVDQKTFTYNGIKLKIKSPDDATQFKINGKDTDVSHVVSEDDKLHLWILNNAALPLIVQSTGLTTDITISEIK
ncbi:hypothetical protein [Pedobacter punctiformis]|uniref:Uncharacterized protein n=1 Tax=Pedobacter punctiformis TaxID=3004097 RepID=A0ABT4LCC1_9SPHI|nr:hypothetical protein [Pedobacter sp. HCMS5-2]MCZ4245543.1 hypothetical protein [Pedobacter sp. HCMS5-2]